MPTSFALALHGGAGPIREKNTLPVEQHLAGLLQQGEEMLRKGAPACDVVVTLLADMEASALYIAGRGSSPNRVGEFELDASIMQGHSRQAGAVCAMRGFVSPIKVARGVMEKTPHVLLAGTGAEQFASEHGFETIIEPDTHFTPISPAGASTDALSHGTIGCVVLDHEGHLVAGTSTGGVLNKLPGRVGDSPLIGAGTWADERVGVSCTGQGEYFIRAAAAADVSARMSYAGLSVDAAAAGALADMQRQGGDGGIIAIDAKGQVAMPFSSQGMRRAYMDACGRKQVAVFR